MDKFLMVMILSPLLLLTPATTIKPLPWPSKTHIALGGGAVSTVGSIAYIAYQKSKIKNNNSRIEQIENQTQDAELSQEDIDETNELEQENETREKLIKGATALACIGFLVGVGARSQLHPSHKTPRQCSSSLATFPCPPKRPLEDSYPEKFEHVMSIIAGNHPTACPTMSDSVFTQEFSVWAEDEVAYLKKLSEFLNTNSSTVTVDQLNGVIEYLIRPSENEKTAMMKSSERFHSDYSKVCSELLGIKIQRLLLFNLAASLLRKKGNSTSKSNPYQTQDAPNPYAETPCSILTYCVPETPATAIFSPLTHYITPCPAPVDPTPKNPTPRRNLNRDFERVAGETPQPRRRVPRAATPNPRRESRTSHDDGRSISAPARAGKQPSLLRQPMTPWNKKKD